jgi:1,4-dihydroxy-2-naphthoyl-CoA synthase
MTSGNVSAGAELPAEAVLYQVETGIATITLNRPERRNALSARWSSPRPIVEPFARGWI